MFPPALLDEATSVLDACRARRIKLATAEGCTGGLLVAVLTAIPGSSDVVDRGFVAYSNEAKTALLGVLPELIACHGAASEEVARAMAQAAQIRSSAGIAVAVTGITGPGGATSDKPVGLICFGLARHGRDAISERQIFPGDRTAVRIAAVAHALGMIRASLSAG